MNVALQTYTETSDYE